MGVRIKYIKSRLTMHMYLPCKTSSVVDIHPAISKTTDNAAFICYHRQALGAQLQAAGGRDALPPAFP